MTNYFGPQQKLISKARNGAKVTKKYDTPKTPHRRASDHEAVDQHDKTILADTYRELNPAGHPTRDPGTDRPDGRHIEKALILSWTHPY